MARHLGLDPGLARCGVAISDSDSTLAFPRPALRSDDTLIERLRELVAEERVATLVVGRPVALSGNETSSTHQADELFVQLVAVFGDQCVVQCDERLTTHDAQRSLTRAGVNARESRDHVDSAAAVILLQHYLDAHRA